MVLASAATDRRRNICALALSAFAAVPVVCLLSLTAAAEPATDRANAWQKSAAGAAAAAERSEADKSAQTETQSEVAPTAATAEPSPVTPAPVDPIAAKLEEEDGKTDAAGEKAEAPKSDGKASDGKAAAPASAQGKGKSKTKTEKPPPIPAKELFGAAKTPAPLAARAIGTYAKGCLAGGQAFPVDGPAWQAMRLSRNRNWGHPVLVALLERFANEVKKEDGWNGLLVGDLAQPRGGPMLTGHASHQIGLDADVWLTPMPDRRFTDKERETVEATSMLAADDISVNLKVWTDGQVKIIKRAASYRLVERVLVHPAIKKALCEAAGTDRGWLSKVRPYWGHYYHFHVRIGCPSNSPSCASQAPVPGDDGCGKELEHWIKQVTPKKPGPAPKPSTTPVKPAKPKPQITMAQLPTECRTVLASGEDTAPVAGGANKTKPEKAAKN